MRSSQADVEQILRDMRFALQQNKMTLIPRRKNLDTLSKKGWLWRDVKNAMINLTYNDYREGPELDYDDPTSDKLWIFKTNIDNDIIYIKFKVMYQTDGRVKTLSFHIDEP